ncbi:MAG: L-lactate permease [Propionicimonas sp.]|uniref:L-lactate permease n=1 Tax=Propionicimonas sp. TaxID=1955623 RepID=UPI003D0B445C
MLSLFIQPPSPVGGSLALSALVAALPLLVLFVMLGVFKIPAWKSALVAVVTAVILAVAVWGMPAATAATATAEGIFFGIFQIMWILVSAIWLYNLSVKHGWDKVLGELVQSISSDMRILAILIAFCFGALLEALAGFGAPVAITAAMLVAAGMKPIKAAVVCMVANTAPVAFGAMGAPITALGNSAFPILTQGHFANAYAASVTFGHMAGRQSPIMALFIPLFLVWLVDGVRGLKQTWGVALTAGAVFAVCQFVASNFIAYEVTDVIASVVTIVVIIVVLRFVKSSEPSEEHAATKVTVDENLVAAKATGGARVWGAIAPYVIVVGVFAISQIPVIKTWLSTTLGYIFNWPGLQGANFPKADGKVVPQPLDFCGIVTASQAKAGTVASCTLGQVNLYSVLSTGTLLFLSGVITALVYRMSVKEAAGVFGKTVKSLAFTIITVASVLAIAYIMNGSGMTISLGSALAAAGAAFAVMSPVLGWLGVAITGSDTSANALFGGMQVAAAQGVWPGSLPHEILMATSNSTGGVMGKMISPQSLSVAAAATGMLNQEGEIFRKVVGWSLVLLAVFAVIVVLQSTILIGMVPVP